MSFNLNFMKGFLDKFCGLLKELMNGGNNNSNGSNTNSGGGNSQTGLVNINITGNGNKIYNFIATDELSKIKAFDEKTIEKSVKITTDDNSLWLYCNTEKNQECFALGIYLISSDFESDKRAFWIGLYAVPLTKSEPQDESLLKLNPKLEIEFLGEGWSKTKKPNAVIERFEEKAPEELLAIISTKLEEALKVIKQ